jgi:hypothetical protein
MLAPPANRWIEVHTNPTTRGLAVNFRDIHQRKDREIQLFTDLSQEVRNPQISAARLQQLLAELQNMRLAKR